MQLSFYFYISSPDGLKYIFIFQKKNPDHPGFGEEIDCHICLTTD